MYSWVCHLTLLPRNATETWGGAQDRAQGRVLWIPCCYDSCLGIPSKSHAFVGGAWGDDWIMGVQLWILNADAGLWVCGTGLSTDEFITGCDVGT